MLSGKLFCDLYLDLYTVEHKFPRSFRAMHKICGLIPVARWSDETGVDGANQHKRGSGSDHSKAQETMGHRSICSGKLSDKTVENVGYLRNLGQVLPA
ncbi:hypothetical protein EYB34_15110 [Bordetella trematum]|uniref:hypothetical protein n=1 Tax=Bordetella trematum TaxID=123899 RepID=UPI0014044292|nr:hypothetical protein [Bordetella trematum]QIM72573.1 hypothetical protein EYB34_15110 [Bordetella trematum]